MDSKYDRRLPDCTMIRKEENLTKKLMLKCASPQDEGKIKQRRELAALQRRGK